MAHDIGPLRKGILNAGHVFGLACLFLGIFLEKPAWFAVSIACLIVVMPVGALLHRAWLFRYELLTMVSLIAVQVAVDSPLNALTLVMYLMGILNGMLLPDPRTFGPRKWFALAVLCTALTQMHVSGLSPLDSASGESAFGSNIDDYQIDFRSLTYAAFILLLYVSPHFAGLGAGLHTSLLLILAALGSNKFGMLYALLAKLPVAVAALIVLVLYMMFAILGFSEVEATAARAALWSDFFTNFPSCDASYGVCSDLIINNNEEGVRSFHSIVLDLTWYGGPLGLAAGLLFVVRIACVRSAFGRAAGVMLAVALVFGFPPFFNERHVFIPYAFLIIFQLNDAGQVLRRHTRQVAPVPG